MKKKYFPVIVLVLLCFMGFLPVAYGDSSIEIVTSEFPPYSYSDKGKITGVGTETVEAVLKDLKMKSTIRIYPWKRGYTKASTEKNILIFTISRTEKREDLFKWVGIVSPNSAAFFKLKNRKDIIVNNLNDAKKYSIGSVIGDARAEYLESEKFTKLSLVKENVQNL